MTSLDESVRPSESADSSAGRLAARPEGTIDAAVRLATERARDHLLGLQDEQGWWKGLLETNVTMEAEDLLMRHFLGILQPAEAEATARWIRAHQLPDGSWNTFYEGPGDASTTVECWVALRLAGDPEDSDHLRRAAAFIRSKGGVERTRVFTRIWLALFGFWSWDDLPVIPPEVVLLPTGAPLALADWGCWARQTIVPLAVVATIRPVRPLPFDIEPLRTGVTRPAPPLASWGGVLTQLDKILHRYERRPLKRLRARAIRLAEQWIVDRQEADGSWGGIQPPWVYSVLALHLLGRGLDDAVVAAGIRGLDRFTVWQDTPDGPVRWLEACQSPVWDTALAMIGLSDAGVPSDHPALESAARWLLAEEVTVPGDWRARRPKLAPGGWAFEFDNDLYPDVDDTAEVVMALIKHPSADAAVQRGVAWSVGMQSRDGGWAAFDADQLRRLPTRLPFCDFGEVVDPPSADVTAHMVEMLARCGLAHTAAAQRGIRWLLEHQEPGGSWFGRWGVNHVYGTGAVVPALIEAGVSPAHPAITRAVAWLLEVQQEDGGWGEDIRSYTDPTWIGRGPATASQTAWALLALIAAGTAPEAVERGVAWLVRTQRSDGTWDEPQYTGTGFPGDFSINYHLYRLVFPLSALGRYLRGTASGVSA